MRRRPPRSFDKHERKTWHRLRLYQRFNRASLTREETLLWHRLHSHQLGVRFSPQYPLLNRFLGDFVCIPAQLVVEVDGPYHEQPFQRVHDAMRQAVLESRGWSVLRVTNAQVQTNIAGVLAAIRKRLAARLPHYSLPDAVIGRKRAQQQAATLDYYHRLGS